MPKDELIAALEKATADQQGELLMKAFTARFPAPSETWGDDWQDWFYRRTYFVRVLDARAYESAALTLVPEGWTRDVDATAPEMGIAVTLHEPKGGPDGKRAIGDHASEAIAIVIAALRATERGEAGR